MAMASLVGNSERTALCIFFSIESTGILMALRCQSEVGRS